MLDRFQNSYFNPIQNGEGGGGDKENKETHPYQIIELKPRPPLKKVLFFFSNPY